MLGSAGQGNLEHADLIKHLLWCKVFWYVPTNEAWRVDYQKLDEAQDPTEASAPASDRVAVADLGPGAAMRCTAWSCVGVVICCDEELLSLSWGVLLQQLSCIPVVTRAASQSMPLLQAYKWMPVSPLLPWRTLRLCTQLKFPTLPSTWTPRESCCCVNTMQSVHPMSCLCQCWSSPEWPVVGRGSEADMQRCIYAGDGATHSATSLSGSQRVEHILPACTLDCLIFCT